MESCKVYKSVIFGEAGTGKTSFLQRMKNRTFVPKYEPTMENEPYVIKDDKRKICYIIWDTSGQDQTNSLNNEIYKDADFGIFTYSQDSKLSFNSRAKWISNFKCISKVPIMILATKSDVESKITSIMPNTVGLSNRFFFDTSTVLTCFNKLLVDGKFDSIHLANLLTSNSVETSAEEEEEESDNEDFKIDVNPNEDVTLISHSQGTHSSISDTIVFCARVSNLETQEKNKGNAKLIKYLIKHGHWSPFEMANICLEIVTTRDISRQILRHRSFSFQEFSLRYAEVLNTCSDREARLQDTKNRQNSIVTEDEEIIQQWLESQEKVLKVSKENYEKALSLGIAKEQARALLPEGLTKTKIYMNGSVRSWIHFIQTRSGPETQKEHRLIALKCARVISAVFPEIMDFVHE